MKITLIFAIIFAILIALCSSAKYSGRSAGDASRILDASQGKAPEGSTALGHPRGHAKGRDSRRYSINSLQDYSRSGRKSGFRSRSEQNLIVNMALRHPTCQSKINNLNRGSLREVCTIPASYFRCNCRIEEWLNGSRSRIGNMRSVTLVLGHFRGQRSNRNANVHIQTAFPSF